MKRNLEIERKFLVARLPHGWGKYSSGQIVQGYFPITTPEVEIRLRRKGSQHFITIKTGRGGCRMEEEMEISKSRFKALWPFTVGARISKRRYNIPRNGYVIELDIYQGPHRGLVTADVEFDSLADSRAFKPPAWLGAEITARAEYSNATLARQQSLPIGLQHSWKGPEGFGRRSEV